MRTPSPSFFVFGTLAVLATSGCDSGLGPEDLALAGDFTLGIEEAARMVAPAAELPNDAQVMEAVIGVWTDYALLAWAANEAGELQRLDLSYIVQLQVSSTLVERLRDRVIQVPPLAEEELRQMFEENRPGLQVRARHVLLRFPEPATPAQRDSVRRLAVEIRDQARAGVDFGSLAATYSSDPGSSAVGGDLGFFERGQMVVPFEDAAFALSPGEVSDLVQTEFGLHVIKLEERREPTYEEMAEQYRAQLEFEGLAQAESIYIEALEGRALLRVPEGAIALAREASAEADGDSGPRANEVLVEYEGGTLTAGELRDFILGQVPELREQIAIAPDDQIDLFLRDLARDELLVADARRRGIVVSPQEVVAFEGQLRSQYRDTAELLGLYPVEPEPGESMAEAVDRQVKDLVARVVRGESDVVPIGPLSNPLRALYRTTTSSDGRARAVARVDALRAEGFTSPLPTGGPAPAVPRESPPSPTAPAPPEGGTPAPTPGA